MTEVVAPAARRVGISVGAVYIFQVLNLLIPLLLLPFLARTLGAETWGILAAQSSLSFMCFVVLEYGFEFHSTRRARLVKGDSAALSVVVRETFGAKTILIGVVCGFWVLLSLYDGVVQSIPSAYWWTLGLTVVQGLLPAWFFQSIGRLGLEVFLEFAARFVAVVLLFVTVTGPEDAYRVPMIQSICLFVSLIVCIVLIWLSTGTIPWPSLGGFPLLWKCAPLASMRLLTTASAYGNSFLASVLVGAPVPMYSAAERTSNAIRSMFTPISRVLFPEFVTYIHSDRCAARRRLNVYLSLSLVASALTSIVVSLFAPQIVRIIFGPGFASASILLTIICWSLPAFIVCQVVGQQWFIAAGNDKLVAIVLGFGLLVNIVGALIFVPENGVVGLALVFVVSEYLAAGILMVCYARVTVRQSSTPAGQRVDRPVVLE